MDEIYVRPPPSRREVALGVAKRVVLGALLVVGAIAGLDRMTAPPAPPGPTPAAQTASFAPAAGPFALELRPREASPRRATRFVSSSRITVVAATGAQDQSQSGSQQP